MIFLGQLIHGNLGQSISLDAPVGQLIQERFPVTLELAVAAILIVLVVAVPLGIFSAYWRGGWLDRCARLFAALGQSAPGFWVGLLLIVVFAVRLRILPAGGRLGLESLVLPAVTLAIAPVAGLTRLLRSSMIEVLNTDYVKFLRVKGLSERQILWKHALRNAGLAALTFVGVLMAELITGSIVIELVFDWPGMGQLLGLAIQGRDFPVIQAVVLMFSLIFVVVNLLVDITYTILDPRLRVGAQSHQ